MSNLSADGGDRTTFLIFNKDQVCRGIDLWILTNRPGLSLLQDRLQKIFNHSRLRSLLVGRFLLIKRI